ncbi:hypothetical protein [Desulfosporosinus nitroreducens]|uniref:Uncharacterized protein n=1 Tax=Desulfosporosinus nitroreducens TaxID=2018668 RepID=A0ABT8QPP3_9FIRM|nr:hypothetical protein [Desulfosporosinus nitroreducens]MDO0823318.1 hypothetical protein [Desulfosporosinus nitroreducens]
MPRRIINAIYREGETEEIVLLSQMNESVYQNKYKGFLFCPNKECKARIVFATGEKRTYFRTWKSKVVNEEIMDEHIEDCPYFVEHNLVDKPLRRRDESLLYKLSSDHINRVLKKSFDRQFNPSKLQNRGKSKDGEKGASSRVRSERRQVPQGSAGLGSDGALDKAEREPSVFTKSVDDIIEADYGTVQCVDGFADKLIFGNDYPYILLTTKNDKKARIVFTEAFAANNDAQYKNLVVYEKYIDYLSENEPKPFCSCIGKVTKDNFGVTVNIEDYIALRINNKNYYQIIRDINKIK